MLSVGVVSTSLALLQPSLPSQPEDVVDQFDNDGLVVVALGDGVEHHQVFEAVHASDVDGLADAQ